MSQKFKVSVEGGHEATIEISQNGSAFVGKVTTPEYGTGEITQGKVDGHNLTGKVSLAGHTADFSATLSGSSISGRLKVGWFFNKSFTGAVLTA